MASAVVGLLRVLLTANTAEYQSGMKGAASATRGAVADMTAAGSKIAGTLTRLSGQFKDAELGNVGFNRAMRDFAGIDVVGKATAYANAVSAIGGASKLTEAEQRKVNAAVTEALAKYAALGKQAPADLRMLAEETKQLKAPTEAAGLSFGKLVGSLVTAQAIIGLAKTGFRELKEFVLSSVDAYAQQESAVKKMTTALRAQGTETPQVIADYKAMASQFQKTTVFADELVNEMQALLVEVGGVMPAQMQGALKAATDLASGLGIDLRTATLLVGKAFAGETGTLKRYGIVIDEAKLKTEGASAVLSAIQAKFGGQAQSEIETYAGKVKQLANAWSEVQEAVGEKIVQDPVLLAAMRDLQRGVSNQEGSVSLLKGAWDAMLAASPGWVQFLRTMHADLLGVSAAANAAHANITRAFAQAPKMPDFGGTPRPNQFGTKPLNVTKYLEDQAAADKKAADAARQHAAAVLSLANAFAGLTVIKAADDALDAFLFNQKRGIDLADMSEEQQVSLNKTLGAGVDAYERLGKTAPEALQRLYIATTRLEPVTAGLTGEFRNVGVQLDRFVIPNVIDASKLLTYMAGIPFGVKVGEQVDLVIPKIQKLQLVSEAYGEAIAEIGSVLSQFGEMIGGSSGSVLSSLGSISTGLGNATTATGKYMKAVQDGTATTADAIQQYGLMINTAWNLGKALVALANYFDGAGDAEAAMRAQGGNVLRDFQLAARLAGQNLSILSKPQNTAEQAKNLALINRAIADNERMMNAYNLTWRDFGDITGEFITQTAKDLARDFKTLTARGVDGAKVIKGMSGSLNQLIIDAVDTGKKIPAALQPMIEKMIRMGLVTNDAARKMLGLAADTMPSLEDITAAADRYGLTLDKLGPKVKQLSITAAANQIVKDFDILTRAGVPLAVLMEKIPGGFQEKVQGLVTDAIKLGLALPAALKPMLQILVDAGLLTDEFGNKLTSLDGLTFAESITDSVDRLIDKLDLLIDTLSGVGDEFERTAGRARGAAEIIGQAIPRVPPGSAPPPPPSEDTPPPLPGDYAVRRASGGVVPSYSSAGARILKFIPKGTDTVPMMLTPKEGVLNTSAMRAIGPQAFNDLNAGRVPSLLQATGTDGAAPRVVNLSVTVSGEVISSQERAQEMGRELAKEIRRGGDLLTKWQDLPLVRDES